MSKSRIPKSFSYIGTINCNEKIYEVYENQSFKYRVYTDVESNDDDELGILVGNYDFNSRVLNNMKTDNDTILAIIEDNLCSECTGPSCTILGGKLRKTKRSSRSRKNRRMTKTRRRRGKK